MDAVIVSSKVLYNCELSIDQPVRFLVMESAHSDSSSQLGTGTHIFLDLLQDLTAPILLVIGIYIDFVNLKDLPVQILVDFVNLKDLPVQVLEGAYRGGVRVCIHCFAKKKHHASNFNQELPVSLRVIAYVSY
jgi:hypothetical protein